VGRERPDERDQAVTKTGPADRIDFMIAPIFVAIESGRQAVKFRDE